jgi:hypothetical protein
LDRLTVPVQNSFVAAHSTWVQLEQMFRKVCRHAWQTKKLGLVTQPLLVPVRLHALTALMFGDFGFAAFFN